MLPLLNFCIKVFARINTFKLLEKVLQVYIFNFKLGKVQWLEG